MLKSNLGQIDLKKKNTIRNLIAALIFDMIRRKKNITQTSSIKKLMVILIYQIYI